MMEDTRALSGLDIGVIAVYLAVIIGIGFWAKRQAGRGVEAYFLGARSLPWWAIALRKSTVDS